MKDLISIDLKSTKVSDAGSFRDRGFTLVELLVAMVVSSIIMAAIYSVYVGLTRSYTTQNVAAEVQQAVRATIDYMAEDIMMAGLSNYQKKYTNAPGIIEAGSKKISLRADRNMNGIIDGDYDNIAYELVGNELQITDAKGTETFIDNVIQFEFRYFKENAADTPTDNDLIKDRDLISHYGLADPIVKTADPDDLDSSDIRTVEISIIVEEPAGIGGPVQRTYTTRVRCRNAGF